MGLGIPGLRVVESAPMPSFDYSGGAGMVPSVQREHITNRRLRASPDERTSPPKP